ncbi:protease complex subunit PrcB family protein [Deinococcus sp. 23YEL01]|uniref:protease complex subunit PrcB family protein n=1 Tax=Deinococcus sp. 23YEL01 TaxID=2745871 RepID=UPI001E5C645D|nr:protease complex subunit PrcB family protein [Deinococcus sp. 23YEL01]MCD0171115.1 protease complex subunit PrcB family protein [Deinococcus sp. 23YEL01]
MTRTPRKTLPAAAILGVSLLSACTMTGPSNLRVHEALLYGGTQERIVWVYGTLAQGSAQSSVKLGAATADLRAQVNDPLALEGTLSVNGKATFRAPTTATTQKLSVTRRTDGTFNVTPLPGAALSAVYFTDGQTWTKLNGTSGVVTGTRSDGLSGAGQLSSAEATALGNALLGQGPLAVGVLDSASIPDAPLTVEPAPGEYQRTGLYVLPNVTTQTAVTPTPGTPARPTLPGTGTPPAVSLPGAAVTFTEIATGSQATVTGLSVQTARTDAEARALYAAAYGRQTGVPTPAALNGSTLVGVFLGQRATGGYSVKVTGASVSGGTLTVAVQVRAPAAGSFTTQAITSPWAIVRVPGSFSTVNVVDETGQPLRATGSGTNR